jgi:hypothetical protein
MMKTTLLKASLIGSMVLFFNLTMITAQDESKWSTGADFVSRYVWRGTDFGNAPAIQPSLAYTAGNFTIGAWGSYALSAVPYLEADLFASYSFGFGLDLIFTDYYFPSAVVGGVTDNSYFDSDFHTFELGLSQAIGDFYVSGYYFLNANSDLYFEAGYGFKNLSIFAGMGNESYTMDGKFNVCNIGLSTSRDIEITEKFSIPVTGAFILNPDKEQVNIVFSLSF